jgi:hypothetical protein
MAANKKPRKAYRPRTVIANTLEMATLGSACVPQAVADSYLGPLVRPCRRRVVGTLAPEVTRRKLSSSPTTV